MVFPSARLFRAPIWCPSVGGGTRGWARTRFGEGGGRRAARSSTSQGSAEPLCARITGNIPLYAQPSLCQEGTKAYREPPVVRPRSYALHPPTPRKRFGLEIARFAIYLSIPVVAITVCSDPKNLEIFLRGFNFVEYPPRRKKLPSADEIVKMMEQRKSRRLSAQVDATRAALDARLATRPGATADANASPEPQQQRAEELATHQGLTAPLKKTSGWLTGLWRGGDSRDDPSDTDIPK